jgi:circadian clock protein KaiB
MPRKPTKSKPTDETSISNGAESEQWVLKLYIAGQTPKSLTAFSNLKRFCEENVPGKYHIEVIDLAKNPQLAKTDQILAIPTLVRKLPAPMRKIIGDLSDKQKVLLGFDLKPLP